MKHQNCAHSSNNQIGKIEYGRKYKMCIYIDRYKDYCQSLCQTQPPNPHSAPKVHYDVFIKGDNLLGILFYSLTTGCLCFAILNIQRPGFKKDLVNVMQQRVVTIRFLWSSSGLYAKSSDILLTSFSVFRMHHVFVFTHHSLSSTKDRYRSLLLLPPCRTCQCIV